MKTRTFRLDKLVRDRIVEHHLAMGGEVDFRVLTGEELLNALADKLVEEAHELKQSNFDIKEIADVIETLETIISELGLGEAELTEVQAEKRRKNGGLELGHFVTAITLPEDCKRAQYYAENPDRFPEIIDKE